MTKQKIIIFLDSFKEKNKLQLTVMKELGYQSCWFVTDAAKHPDAHIEPLQKSGLKRLWQVTHFLAKNRRSIHHVEIYPGGRFSFLYALLAKVFHLPILCCERGDLQYYLSKKYDAITRFSMRVVYKLAQLVWYREPYMLEPLKQLGVKQLYFAHNCVDLPALPVSPIGRDIDFLWVNRLIPERKFEWVAHTLSKDEFNATTTYVLGVNLQQALFKEHEKTLLNDLPSCIHLVEYTDPRDYYLRAKFFVLPATIIFANNALLEAMSYGVVPIITQTDHEASTLIVENGVQGFVTAFNEDAFAKAMHDAMHLSEEEREKRSTLARQKIQEDFSPEKYKQSLQEMYQLIGGK